MVHVFERQYDIQFNLIGCSHFMKDTFCSGIFAAKNMS